MQKLLSKHKANWAIDILVVKAYMRRLDFAWVRFIAAITGTLSTFHMSEIFGHVLVLMW